MISFLRWTGRILLVLGILGLLACGGVIWVFEGWRKAKLAELDAGSKVAETSAGPVEYAEKGAGPAVLICHGAPGGYDQAMLIGESLADSGCRVIAPSRPGFLRTPLTSGLTFEEQADALVALLETLGIEDAAVVGFSTGSEVAMQFALRHPKQTRGVVLLSPVTEPYFPEDKSDAPKLLTEHVLFGLTGDMGSWLSVELAQRRPRGVLDGLIGTDTSLAAGQRNDLAGYVMDHPDQLEFFRGLVSSAAPLSSRETGTRNDLVMLRGLLPSPFEKITAPTLAVFGTADSASKWSNPEALAAKIPSAKIVKVEGAGHIVWFGHGADAMKQAVRDFLGNLGTSAAPPDEELPR